MNYKKDLSVPQFEQKAIYSCIPACLQQVFGYYKKQISQEEIIRSMKNPRQGMSIPAAGAFSRRHGFKSLIITNNVTIFDPTWLSLDNEKLIKSLKKRKKNVNKYNQSLINDYLEYIKMEGQIRFEESINGDLFKKYLSKNIPIIVELSSSSLYKNKKRKSTKPEEIKGHGVVVAGFNKNQFKIVDPDSENNPYSKTGVYWISIKDLIISFSELEGKSLLLISKESKFQ